MYVCKKVGGFFSLIYVRHHFKTNMYPCNISWYYHGNSGCISISCPFCKKIKKMHNRFCLYLHLLRTQTEKRDIDSCARINHCWDKQKIRMRDASCVRVCAWLRCVGNNQLSLQIKQKHESHLHERGWSYFLYFVLYVRLSVFEEEGRRGGGYMQMNTQTTTKHTLVFQQLQNRQHTHLGI